MFTVALFTIAKTGKQPKCPSMDIWIKNMCCVILELFKYRVTLDSNPLLGVVLIVIIVLRLHEKINQSSRSTAPTHLGYLICKYVPLMSEYLLH